MGVYSADVAVRWSDMDVFGHVNNARVVTLLEEARTQLLFTEGARCGAGAFADGLVVVELQVRYHAPVVYSPEPLRVHLWVSELRAAWFALDYAILAGGDTGAGGDGAGGDGAGGDGAGGDGVPVGEGRNGGAAVTARTQLAPIETATGRPRRLSPAERGFLADYRLTTGSEPATTGGAAGRDGAGGG